MTGPRFVVEPWHALTTAERAALSRLSPADGGFGDAPPFQVRIVSEPAWRPPDPSELPDLGPARLAVVDGHIRVLHRRFLAELDPAGSAAWLQRREPPAGLNVVLRLAASCRLPMVGGLPLHAAGVILDGHGLAFFGPSGAGKSTLAGSFDGPVLSDELVAVAGRPFRVWGTGFWGTFDGGPGTGSAPLAALVALHKGPRFAIERLDVLSARRRLLDAILVPLEARLWSAALGVAGALVREVPVYRLTWSPSASPWDGLRRALLADAPVVPGA